MKKTILFLICAVLLMSCGGAGKQPSDLISLGMAFKIVSATGSYWLWLFIVAAVSGVVAYFLVKDYRQNQSWSHGHSMILVASVALLLAAIFVRPCEIAQNTTVEQAKRGGVIGY